MVAGPNPAEGSNPNNKNVTLMVDSNFIVWLTEKYSKNYSKQMALSAKKYEHLIDEDNLSSLELLTVSQRNRAIKALKLLAKFQGRKKEFDRRLSDFDIKLQAPDSLKAFNRILDAQDKPCVLGWIRSIEPFLEPHERLYIRFLLHSGLRAEEGQISFNKIIELATTGELSHYYNTERHYLLHARYPEVFIRRTKNTYLTFISPAFVEQISRCRKVHRNNIRKKLVRHGFKMRLSELRDYNATYLRNHLLAEEVDMLQGRVGKTVFQKHYWTPELDSLCDKVLTLLDSLLQSVDSGGSLTMKAEPKPQLGTLTNPVVTIAGQAAFKEIVKRQEEYLQSEQYKQELKREDKEIAYRTNKALERWR